MIANQFGRLPLLAAMAAIGVSASAEAATPVFINEIHYDNAGSDSGEAVEIAGPAGTNLSGWKIVPYNGSGGASYTPLCNLNGSIPNQNNGFGSVSCAIAGLQNGAPDGIALVDAGNAVVQFLSYEGTFTASNGPANGMASVDIGVLESGSGAAGQSLQLKGSGSHYQDFAWAAESAASFGNINAGQTFGGVTPPPPPVSQCGQPATPISAIQGSGGVSPLNGSLQHVEAVVSSDFQGSGNLNGFFVQQGSDADANPATSEGLFVAANTPVNAGDRVHIVGNVAETYGMTRLENVSSVEICSSGNALPAAVAVNLPFDSAGNDPERWEGMLIHLPQTLTVTENYNLARYGEFLLSSGGRLWTPTQVAAPGQAANDVAAQNGLNQLLVDDGSTLQNPDPVIYPQPAGLSTANSLRSGATVAGATGVLAYDFGVYRLQPTQPLTFSAGNPRPANPAPTGPGSLKVASFNVLNYFNGNGLGGGFPTARGANTLAEFNRQRAKIVAALHQLDADVVGLMEIENDGYAGTSAIADLVNGLNQLAGAGSYAFVNPGRGKIGSDEIAVGIIYKPAKVTAVGKVAILDSSVNPQFIDTKNRPTLAQTFLDKASNKLLTVAVNHLKSKGSACDDVNDPDTGDGQGNCNLTRTTAATALANWLAGDPTQQGAANTLIVGDLNSYAQEDPISALKNAGYRNLLETMLGNQAAYSYVFDGAAGYLDHALANASLAAQVKTASEWHINADEPRALDYNVEFKTAGQVDSFYAADAYRSSDHDPLLVKLFVPGDLDNDGDVDGNDANSIKAQVGKCSGKVGFNREADYDATGCVSMADYRTWYGYLNNYTAISKP